MKRDAGGALGKKKRNSATSRFVARGRSTEQGLGGVNERFREKENGVRDQTISEERR